MMKYAKKNYFPKIEIFRKSLLFSILLLYSDSFAQTISETSTSAEIGGYVSSSDQVPFWLRANQWGSVPLASPFGTARLGFRYQSPTSLIDSSARNHRLRYEFRAEAVANTGTESKLVLLEAFGKLRWKQWELMAGRQRQIVGIVDSTLSSGSYSWSGNALPIPMVWFGLAEYLPFDFLKNFISIKGSFAHGWFWDTYIEKSYLHQKTLYGRIGKPEGNVHVQIGIAHHVMWGGEADYLRGTNLAVNGKLTSTFQNYISGIVLAQIPKQQSSGQFTNFDGTNRIGNHVGHIDMAVDWRINKTKFMLYRQHPFEDASGLQFQNLPDGLYGLSLQRNSSPASFFTLKGLVVEFLHTKNQSGDFFTIPGSRFSGADGYFNHGQYKEGWSYKERGLGNPFIPTQIEVGGEVVQNGLFFPTNRTILYHLGMNGLLAKKVKFMIKFSNSRHYPASATPISDPTFQQFSSLLAFDAPISLWRDTRLKAQIAYDKGGVLPDSFGGYLGIKSYFRK